MSRLKVNRIAPRSGGVLEIEGRVRFLNPVPGQSYGPVNDIGSPGGQGFGVGTAPELPTGMIELSGSNDPASGNYGNYKYSDGSIMVWVPAFFYKFGTGSNGLAANRVDILPLSAYTSIASAAAAGYALHRAFYDGGQVKSGFFIDKFHCSNNGGIASSIRYGIPVSSSASNNTFSGLTGSPSNSYGGAFAVSKTRGSDFFPSSRFLHSAIALLALAHAQASSSTTFCAWYTVGSNFPKGNNNNALGDSSDGVLSFQSAGYSNSSKCGSANFLAKTTHNGQESGIADLNGNLWHATPGLTYGTAAAGTGYYVLKTASRMKDLTGGNAISSDAFGATGIDANYDFAGPSFGYASSSGGARPHRFGSSGSQVLSEATSGLSWQMMGLGLPMSTGASAAGTVEFGQDYIYDNGPSPTELCPISGGNWSGGSGAGVWALTLSNGRGDSNGGVGCRLGLYL